MHTSSVVYHRLYFKEIIQPAHDFDDMVDFLGLVETDRPDVYDIHFDEGYSLSVGDAIVSLYPENKLEVPIEVCTPRSLATAITAMAKKQGITLHSKLFNADWFTGDPTKELEDDDIFEHQIQCDQLFDLISVMANGYELIGIYTEWAINSSKVEYGSHSGGAVVTTRQFMVPTTMPGDQAEEIIMKFSSDNPEELADFYVDEFIRPRLDALVGEPFKNAIFESLRRLTE